MSYSVPGPGGDNFGIGRVEQPSVDRGAPIVASRQTPAGSSGEPPVDHLMRANQERLAALQAENEQQLARSALVEVVADLDTLLDSATSHLVQSGFSRTRKQVRKKFVRDDLAASMVAALPLVEIADLLDVQREQVEEVLRTLRASGALDAATRDEALKQIRYLRKQLRLVEANDDHPLLDRLVALIVRVTQALAVAVATTATSTLAIGGRVVETVLVQAAVTALVTLALQSAATAVREKRRRRDPYVATGEALTSLSSELANFATIASTPAYALEWPVGRIRLLVKTYRAQQALIDIRWDDKEICWTVLAELVACLRESSKVDGDGLARSLGRLRAVQGQLPKG
jgi:hypothetical protein